MALVSLHVSDVFRPPGNYSLIKPAVQCCLSYNFRVATPNRIVAKERSAAQ
jgi:hypothetical protein